MNTMVHDIIKMNLVREGYLPNHPYHLISDTEMIDAFLHVDDSGKRTGYFVDYYPSDGLSGHLLNAYSSLIEGICYHLQAYKSDNEYIIPDWVYSYMMSSCVGPQSDTLDRHDLFVLLNLDNTDDEFTEEIHQSCYETSKEWIRKLNPAIQDHRPPTIFGEPHVIKSLRLAQVDVLE